MLEKRTQLGPTAQMQGEIPIHHRYTLGVAGERFFKAMRDERRLLTSRCPRCGERLLPPKLYCERCFCETAEWAPVEGLGFLRTFTLLHIGLEGETLEPPQAVGLIGWPGVRGGLIHRIGEVGLSGLRTGMTLEPVWGEERKGSLEDILYFRSA